MAIDSSEVQVAPFGRVFVAPVGTAGPTDIDTALHEAFVDLGYIDEDGVTITPGVSVTDHFMWQSTAPVIQTVDQATMEISFMLGQTNRAVTEKFFYGATWTSGAGGVATLDIPSDPSISDLECALVIEFADRQAASGAVNNRLYFPRGTVTEREPMRLVRSEVVKYGITYAVQDSSGSLGTWITENTDLYS